MANFFSRVSLAACAVVLVVLAFAPANLRAQGPSLPNGGDAPAATPDPDPVSDTTSLLTVLPHPESDRIWLSGQANFISQWHPGFHSSYSGPNSLSAEAQDATSRVLTLFTGLRLTGSMELLCDVQESGGNAIGAALGVAGFPNLDVVRNPSLSKAPYVARLMWHQIIPLTHTKVVTDRNPLSLFSQLPERRWRYASAR